MASKKFTQFDTANNTPETEISVGVKGTDNFKRRNYLTATTNPTANDDNSDGYTVGSMWLNTSTGAMYVCQDSTVGAAKWSNGLGYLRLSFNLTQSGTDAPVVDILLNEVGAGYTSEYDGVGSYIFNWNLNVSDLTKVQLFPPTTASAGILIAGVDALRVPIQTLDTSGANTDDLLLNSSFEIRFYPGWDA